MSFVTAAVSATFDIEGLCNYIDVVLFYCVGESAKPVLYSKTSFFVLWSSILLN